VVTVEDGTVRGGVVEAVLPGRHLCFRWWREGEGPESPSQVSYDLEPDEGGTRLTVTEQPVPVDTDDPAQDSAAKAAGAPVASAGAGSWTAWDGRLFGCWAVTAGAGVAARSR